VPENWDDVPDDGLAMHQPSSVEDSPQIGNATASHDAPLSSVTDLFIRPVAPLLPRPTPVPPQPSHDKGQPSSENRRSVRLVNKPKMHVMDKAIQVLNSKMGVAGEGVPLLQARKEYLEKYKTQLPNTTIDALSKLFKLNIRSMTEADEALIAMGGPGVSETATQDLVV
jgi:hypothetical protein